MFFQNGTSATLKAMSLNGVLTLASNSRLAMKWTSISNYSKCPRIVVEK